MIQNTQLQNESRYTNFYILQRVVILTFCVFFALILTNHFRANAAPTHEVAASLNDFPIDNQLYPRDRNSNLATITVSGIADNSNAEVMLRVNRNGTLWETFSRIIGGTLSYNMMVQIPAELASYDFELIAISTTGAQTELASATNVVAGDVFVINGQSNAESGQYEGSGAGDVSNFVRTFGWWQADNWQDHDIWYTPIADCSGSPRCVGQWGLRFGSNIVNNEQIPVAVINGAVGGKTIDHFQRNDASPTDTSTNYGRLLTRLTRGGIKDSIRAIMWYQGESDGVNYTGHINGFTELFQDWEDTYLSVEQYYVFQVRSGCGGDLLSETSNVQREFTLPRSNVTAVSTTGLDGHDGCHYAYANGYQQIGDNMARIIQRDLYNRPLQNADAPDIISANVVDSNSVDLTFTSNNQLVADNGFEELFQLSNDSNNQIIPIGSATLQANSTVRLTTSQSIPVDAELSLSYLSLTGDQNWLTNQSGIGILSFLRFPVQSAPLDCGPLMQEAEAATRTGLFETQSDSAASGGQYVYVPNQQPNVWTGPDGISQITFCLNAPEDGRYRIKADTAANGREADSFYVLVDGAPTNGYLWDVPTSTSFTTSYVTDRNGMSPVEISLAAGEHAITVALRESGTKLDKVALEQVDRIDPPAGSCDGLEREAEDGTITGDFAIIDDPTASGGKAVSIREGDGHEWDGANGLRKIDYCFTVTDEGTYLIEGLVIGADDLSDSFYVRVNNAPSNAYVWDTLRTSTYAASLVSDRFDPNPVQLTLSQGVHSVTIYAREEGTVLDKIALIPNFATSSPLVCSGTTREAEEGLLSGGFVVAADAAASGGQYIHVPNGSGDEWDGMNAFRKAEFCFTVDQAGDYAIKANVYGGTDLDDSFYVQVNGESETGFLWDTLMNSSYAEDYVSDRNGQDPVSVALTAGEHIISVYLREDGTRLDRLALESTAGLNQNVQLQTASRPPVAMGIYGAIRLQSNSGANTIQHDRVKFSRFSVTLVDAATGGQQYSRTIALAQDGSYRLEGMPVGDYLFTFRAPEGYRSTLPRVLTVSLDSNQVLRLSPDVIQQTASRSSYLPIINN